MQVINVATGKPEDLDPIAITEGLAAGTHIPANGQGVLFNPEGNLVFVPGEDVQENVYKYGYKIPQPDELRKAGRDFTYGTDMAQVQAALAGAARGGTFGISDLLAVKTGLTSPEHLSALKEYFPGTSIASEIAGAVGTAFTPYTLVGASVKGARAIEAAAIGKAAAALPKSQAANLIAKTAIETGGKALGGAIEGMAFGLGQSVSESALGDPDLNAEKVIANIGYNALLGGGLGAALNIGSVAASKAVEKAKAVYEKAFEGLIGKTVPGIEAGAAAAEKGATGLNLGELGEELDSSLSSQLQQQIAQDQAEAAAQEQFQPGWLAKKLAKGASVTSGVPEDEILKHFAAEMDPNRVILTPAQKNEKVKQFADNIQQIYETSIKLTKRMSKNVRPKEMEGLLADIAPEGALGQYEAMKNSLKRAVSEMEKDPPLYDAFILRTSQKMVERMEQKLAEGFDSTLSIYDDLVNNRRMLEDLEKFDKINLTRQEEKTLNDFITPLRQSIKNGLTDENIWGQAGARQAAYNQKIANLFAWTEALEKTVMQKVKVGVGRPVYEINPTKINTMFNQINDFRSKIPGRSTSNFLNSFREYLEEAESSLKNTPDVDLNIKSLKDFTGKMSDEALAAKKYVSNAFGGFGYFRDLMEAAKAGGLTGVAARIGQGMTDPDTLIKVLSTIESAGRKASEKVNQTSKFIFEKVKAPARGIGVIIEKESQKDRTERYKKVIERIKNLTEVPDKMLNDLDAATRVTFDYAPKITQGLQLAAVRATTFLQSKIPQPPDKGILDQPYEPSQAQVITFMRYADVVDNPLIVLDQLQNNYVPAESIETLQTVYPSLYSDMKQSIVSELADKMAQNKVDIPYQKRVVLSKFLGMPLDSSFRPEIIGRNQETLAVIANEAAKKEIAQEAVRTTQTGLGKVSLSDRNQTSLEKVISRA